ncbi:hypothetical protein B1A_17236, partial [mine drainage metagenome]
KRVAESLETVHNTLPADGHGIAARLVERRQRLNDYVRVLHTKRAPSGASVFEMQGRLLRLPEGARSTVRWRGNDLNRIDEATAQRVLNLLQDASGAASLFTGADVSPWSGAKLLDGSEAIGAIDLALEVEGQWKAVGITLQALRNAVPQLQVQSVEDI